MRPDSFVLEPVSPFRLNLTVWTLRRRPDNVVDRWDGQTYRRVLPVRAGLVEVAVAQAGPPETPRLCVTVNHAALCPEVQQEVTNTVERLLGLRTDVTGFYTVASHDAALGPLAQRFHGMKPPRFATVFESVITAIASQQVTRTVGVLLLNRLAVSYGAAVQVGESPAYAFPRAEDLARLYPAHLRQLGFSLQKGRAIIELARSITAKALDLEGLADLQDEEAIEGLCGLRGVGRWSAEYVLLRGLGRTHVFPGDDVGGRKNLERWLHLAKPLDYGSVHRTLERWRPYGGLVYFHLLLDRLDEAGFLTAGTFQPDRLQNRVETRYLQENTPMKPEFNVGDHVEWNSEAGRVRGTIKKKVVSAIMFKTYIVHASKEEPQYLIKSDKTDHLAMHKGSALTKINANRRSLQGGAKQKRE
ncbi:MAG: putative DNA-3-methyladenine glycosylase II [Nitrospira sp.]|nr:MAG: putative DNA-3-methyladenine glycosylase II [Nitrospira sp.]